LAFTPFPLFLRRLYQAGLNRRTNPAPRNQAWHRIGAESGRLSGFFINTLQSHNRPQGRIFDHNISIFVFNLPKTHIQQSILCVQENQAMTEKMLKWLYTSTQS
jgi:hypothetical protein